MILLHFFRQLDETLALYGERFAIVFMRKMAAFYCKGVRGAAEYKRRLFSADTVEALRAVAEEVFAPDQPTVDCCSTNA